jgi:hypothetical protein
MKLDETYRIPEIFLTQSPEEQLQQLAKMGYRNASLPLSSERRIGLRAIGDGELNSLRGTCYYTAVYVDGPLQIPPAHLDTTWGEAGLILVGDPTNPAVYRIPSDSTGSPNPRSHLTPGRVLFCQDYYLGANGNTYPYTIKSYP